MRKKNIGLLFCILAIFCPLKSLLAQGTAFTYQGQLNNGGNPASGNYDLTFTLYASPTLTIPIVAGPVTNSAVAVTNGLFTVQLNFGSSIFTGTNYWLEIGVRTNGSLNAFATLAPRQSLTPTPYAIFANSSSNLLGVLPSTQLSGTVPSTQISGTYSSTVVFSNGANVYLGTFIGNGASLSNLNATQLSSGTVADARLSTNVPLLNTNQNFTGTNNFNGVNTFTNFGNSFRGSFFGNGLVGWIATNGTAVQAVVDTGYLLTNSHLTVVTLPSSANAGDIVRISGAGTGGWKIAQNAGQSFVGNFSSYANSYWTAAVTSDNWLSVASSADGSRLVAATQNSGIFVYSDGAWTSYTLPVGAQAVASSADGSRLVAVTAGNGSIYTFTSGSSTWVKQSGAPTAVNWWAVASSADGSKLVAVIDGGQIYVSMNYGATWTAQNVPAGNIQSWLSVASSSNGSNFTAVAYGGGIYTNSGNNWSATGAPAKNWNSVASSADATKLAAVVFNGGIYTSANSGASWTQQTSAPTEPWCSIASSADGGKLAAAATNGLVYVSGDYGATWSRQTGVPAQHLISIASSADGTKLATAVYNLNSGVYVSQSSTQLLSMTGTNGFISGGQGTAVELQYIGNNQFMPVSSVGNIWAN